jgi:hypothetical protein
MALFASRNLGVFILLLLGLLCAAASTLSTQFVNRDSAKEERERLKTERPVIFGIVALVLIGTVTYGALSELVTWL